MEEGGGSECVAAPHLTTHSPDGQCSLYAHISTTIRAKEWEEAWYTRGDEIHEHTARRCGRGARGGLRVDGVREQEDERPSM